MKSFGWALIHDDWYPHKRGEVWTPRHTHAEGRLCDETETQGGQHVKKKAEIRGILVRPKNTRG